MASHRSLITRDFLRTNTICMMVSANSNQI